MAKVGIVMGSDSDMPVMAQAADFLEKMGIEFEMRVISAHREPDVFFEWAKAAEGKGMKVIIAGAGMAAHLPGMCAALFPMPVIGVPLSGKNLAGEDALFSIVQMPPGIPVATVAIDGGMNAAILAAKKALKKTGLPREKIGIFFISPCPSKVTYVRAPLGNEHSEVDAVLAIKDVYPQLLSRMKAVGNDYPEIGTSGKIGISWGRSGGESSGLLSESYLAADGIENVIRVLEDLEDQKFSNLEFVELNACNGGCVGGILAVENPYVAEVKLKRLRRYMPVARTHMSQDAEQVIPWTTGVQFEPVFRLGTTMMESFSRLNQVERLCKKLPGLDCGSCGAPTCKALAADIVRGDAQETDCVYCLRENLHKLSEEVSILADDLASGDTDGKETLRLLKDYIQRISSEMSVLDRKDDE